ncbi:MAG: hypothetical protein JXB62_15075 [Pirellulales bacterium]|nr:hypothetical protein [Pirellulales bacterium]
MLEHRDTTTTRHHLPAYVAWVLALNLPFLVCHPGWPLLVCPWLRALAVGSVILLVPGIAWVGVMIGCHRLDRFRPIWAVAASLAVMLGALLLVHVTGWSLCGSTVWNITWALTDAGVLLHTVVRRVPTWGLDWSDPFAWLGAVLFLAAHVLYFHGATRVVPLLEDQDFHVFPCSYGLLTRGEPLHVSHLQTYYHFAHPPLMEFCIAGSFLYFDQFESLAYYDEASRRALAARNGIDFAPFGGTVGGLAKGTVENHRVVGRDGPDYLVEPPLNDGSRRIEIWRLENAVMVQHYERDPQRLPARATNVFLAAWTVAWLGCWIGRRAGKWPLAIVVPLAYATSPEVFVRSSYGGYFAGSNFAAWMLLTAVEQRPSESRRSWWAACSASAVFLGLVNQKLVLLPAALVLWRLLDWTEGTISRRAAKALLHPAVVGFAAGLAVFWAWGLSVAPADFWQMHVRIHFLDRLIHYSPFEFGNYPSRAGLWIEFWQHTGYALLPLGIMTLAALWLRGARPVTDEGHGSRDADRPVFSPGLWVAWTLLTAVAFTLVDWRETKHLGPLFLSLFVAPACWAATSPIRLRLVCVLMLGLTLWNLDAIWGLVRDFASFSVTPQW